VAIMKKQYFHNVWKLMKFILKRDWVRILIWVASIIIIETVIALALAEMYPTQVDRESFKLVMDNPVMIAMFGKAYGYDNYTFGAMWAHMMYLWMGLIVGIMGIILVTKHLRNEEEEGRYEIIRSLPVGRDAYLLATILLMAVVVSLMTIFKTLVMTFLGIDTFDFLGSLNYSLGHGLIAMFFIALSAVISQLYQSNRSVMGMGFGLLLTFYLVFAIGMISLPFLKWLSPFQYLLESQAYVNNYYWPLLILLTLTVCLIILAVYLSSVRDLDAGLFKEKQGKKNIAKYVRRPFGFAVRTQSTMMMYWALTLFILGASYGSIFGDLESFLGNNVYLQQMLPPIPGVPLATQFMGIIMMVMGIAACIPAVLIANKVANEEKKNRVETIMSHPVSRLELMISFLILGVLAGVFMLLVSAVGFYAASSSVMENPIPFMTMIEAIMVYTPSLILFIGVSALITGFTPDKTWLVNLYLGLSFFIVYIGQIVDIGDLLSKFTPFSYVPRLPVDDMNWFTQAIIVLLGLAFMTIGAWRYKRRDLQG